MKCEGLVVAKDLSDEGFTAKTSCNGRDAYGDDYAVIVDIAGNVVGQFATVSTINMQVIP